MARRAVISRRHRAEVRELLQAHLAGAARRHGRSSSTAPRSPAETRLSRFVTAVSAKPVHPGRPTGVC